MPKTLNIIAIVCCAVAGVLHLALGNFGLVGMMLALIAANVWAISL